MPDYRYRARDLDGEIHTGTLRARNRDELADLLRDRDQFLVRAEEDEPEPESTSWLDRLNSLGGPRPVERRELALFSVQLASALDAGVQILGALDGLEEQASPALQHVLEDMQERIEGGSTLSEAMAHHPQAFDDLYVNLVEAGEETGRVEEVLYEIADFLEWQEEVTGEIKRLSIYPAMVLGAVALISVLLFQFVFPRLLGTITDLNVELSPVTQTLVTINEVAGQVWWVIPVGAVLLFFAPRLVRLHPRGGYAVDWIKMNLPVLGDLFRKISLTRFTHNLAILHSSGVGILRSLELVEGVVDNEVFRQGIRRARERINMGSTLTEALQQEEQFPAIVMQMVSVGEASGSLDRGLRKVSDYYDREIPQTVERLFSVLEPAMIVILGIIIAGVALGVYMPIYSVIQNLGVGG